MHLLQPSRCIATFKAISYQHSPRTTQVRVAFPNQELYSWLLHERGVSCTGDPVWQDKLTLLHLRS